MVPVILITDHGDIMRPEVSRVVATIQAGACVTITFNPLPFAADLPIRLREVGDQIMYGTSTNGPGRHLFE
jgi:hypothetical protein